MQTLVDLVYKQVDDAVRSYWDAKSVFENDPSFTNERRLIKKETALQRACDIRDEYVMSVTL